MAFVRAVAASGGADQPYRGSVVCPPGAEVGDVLAVCHIVDNDIANTAAMTALTPGFVERLAFGPQYVPRCKLWTRQLTGSDLGATFEFQHNTSTAVRSWALVALACGDVDPDNPVEASTTYSRTNNSTAFIAANLAMTAGGCSLVFGAGIRYSTSDVGQQRFTPPSGWTEHYDVGQVWLKPVVYARGPIDSVATGAANASIASSAAQNGQSNIHCVLRHKTYVPPGPSGPPPEQFFPFFGR